MEDRTNTNNTTSQPNTSSYTSPWQTPVLFGVATLAVVLILAGIFSSYSLPGDLLYPMKVRVTEHMLGITKLTAPSKTAYDVARMETRLSELKTLAGDSATSTPEALMSLSHAVSAQSNRAVSTIDASSLSETERMDALARLVNVTKAQETIAGTIVEFEPIADSLEETRNSIEDALEAHIEQFASTSPQESVSSYLGAHIQTVAAELADVASGSDAQRRSIARIEDTNEAILDGDFSRAIESILNAEEAIAVDRYLFDSERGPVEGVELPTVPQEG